MTAQIKIFYSYAHDDERLRKKLEKHLTALQQQSLITGWHDRMISAGTEWEHEIDGHLNEAEIILLLISASFLASKYCYSIEMKRGLERHEAGEALVIPIILRPVYWQEAPFAKLQALPTNGKPVTSWKDQDQAFLDVAHGIRKAIEELTKKNSPTQSKITNNRATVQKKASASSQVLSIPFPRNPFFTDRENILDSLHNILTANNTAAQKRPLALSGLEGAGKTQIALEYAYRYRGDYQYVFWVRCETDETIVSDLLNIAALLNLPKRNVNLPERNARVQDDVVKAVNQWLDMNTNWLLIFDGVEDLPMVGDYQRLSEVGHILLSNLVGLYYVQGKYAEAEALYQHALKINEDILGPDHPSLPTLIEHYAFLLRVINREAEAAELEARAKAIQAKTLMKNSLGSSVL